jgi:hypothetical protein
MKTLVNNSTNVSIFLWPEDLSVSLNENGLLVDNQEFLPEYTNNKYSIISMYETPDDWIGDKYFLKDGTWINILEFETEQRLLQEKRDEELRELEIRENEEILKKIGEIQEKYNAHMQIFTESLQPRIDSGELSFEQLEELLGDEQQRYYNLYVKDK